MRRRNSLKIIGILIAVFLNTAIYAADSSVDNAFKDGLKTAFAMKGKPTVLLNNFKPADVIKNYNENPSETNYYKHPDTIESSARSGVNQDVVGKSILDSSASRKEKFDFSKDPNSPEVLKVIKRADDIYSVITGQYGDCTKKTNCTTTYKNETCEESPKSTMQYCSNKLNIEMVPKQTVTHYPFTIHIATKEHDYAGAVINAMNGSIDSSGPREASFRLDGRIPSDVDCSSLQGSITNTNSQNPATYIDSMVYPTCSNTLRFNLHVSNKGRKGKVNIAIQVDVTSTKIVLEPNDKWDAGCTGLQNNPSCILKEERCLESNTTHDIEGIKVNRACWEKEATYQCGGTGNVQACQPLRDRGCEQIGSTCKDKTDGGCSRYEQKFQCPIKECTDVGMICNSQTYCLDGSCTDQQKKADPDFQKSVSALSAANEAGKSFGDFNSIFTGKRKTCDKVFLGYINCCSDEGWGKDIHLAQCSAAEKDLGKDKENLQTVYLGEYCKKSTAGICIEYRKAYCVFPSKLARIIQVQGRRDQLGIGFGEPENANCGGMTREQFALLDFSKMDFSDFYSDIANKQKLEAQADVSKRVTDNVNSAESRKGIHAK